MIIVVMGVSGAGKSTLGRALADTLGWHFIEGDDYHPPSNIEKMRRTQPLSDTARAPWLACLNQRIQELGDLGHNAVLACSALKKSYRDLLGKGIQDIRFIYLCGNPTLIRQRMKARENHFMPADLLDSQFATLELPEDAVFVPIDLTPAQQVMIVLQAVQVGKYEMKTYQSEIIATGLAFPEGPRWHDGRFWFTDQHARAVCAMDSDGCVETIVQSDDLPGGLGWLPDNSLLVIYMTQRRIMRLSGTELAEYVDLSQYASFHLNDMVVDTEGRIYAGNFGFDLHGGETVDTAELILVNADRTLEVFTKDVIFPNGSVITPNGRILLVAETFAHRITAFQLDTDGRMRSRSIWANLSEATPDGICLDAEHAIWVASPGTCELIRVKQGGSILARCETQGTPYACTLGGDDRRTLYVCTSETDDPEQAVRLRSGRIEQVKVAVPGAGLP